MLDKKDEQKLGKSLIETIANSGTRDIAIDLAEIGVDRILQDLQDETLSQVPILKTLYSIAKTGLAIRDYFFLKKLFLFIAGFKDIDDKLRKKLENDMAEPNSREELGEQILNSLERFDQITKAEALSKLFIAHLQDEINHQEFLRYSYALDKIDIQSIEILNEFYSSRLPREREYLLHNFVFVGLVSVYFGYFGEGIEAPGHFLGNEFGEKFLRLLNII